MPLLFAAVVLAAYFFIPWTDVGQAIAPSPALSDELQSTYDGLTLSHQDPVLGFSVRYPLGYPLESVEGQTVAFYASSPSGVSEMFFWSAVDDDPSPSELKDAAADLDAQLLSERKIRVDGKEALRLEYAMAADQVGEPARLIQGLIPCGNYSLYLSAVIPDTLAQDKDLADYTLSTARCG